MLGKFSAAGKGLGLGMYNPKPITASNTALAPPRTISGSQLL